MALIQCPDCKSAISDRTDACPKCGCPITDEIKRNAPNVYVDEKEDKRKDAFQKMSDGMNYAAGAYIYRSIISLIIFGIVALFMFVSCSKYV